MEIWKKKKKKEKKKGSSHFYKWILNRVEFYKITFFLSILKKEKMQKWETQKGYSDQYVWKDNYLRLENYNNFWLVKTLGIKNLYSRVLLGHIIGCN
jgi:hypothetical protein